jgi:rod shape-determining protein MreC
MSRSSPLFVPRLDWVIFLCMVGLSLTLLFFGRNRAVLVVKKEIGGALAQLGRPLAVVRHTFDLWKENESLRRQAMALSRENAELRDVTLENHRLRGMLNFQQRFPYPLLSAEVIGYPGQQVGGRILLDAGRRAGVRVNSAVLTPDGLVGKVIEVSSFSSLVQSLDGDAYGVSVMIERSRVAGILRWIAPRTWTIVGLSTGEDVRPGVLVLTTGWGSVFPKNLRVGVVSKVGGQSTPNSGWCRVEPFVRFESLEEVFVVTPENNAGMLSDTSMSKKAHP